MARFENLGVEHRFYPSPKNQNVCAVAMRRCDSGFWEAWYMPQRIMATWPSSPLGALEALLAHVDISLDGIEEVSALVEQVREVERAKSILKLGVHELLDDLASILPSLEYKQGRRHVKIVSEMGIIHQLADLGGKWIYTNDAVGLQCIGRGPKAAITHFVKKIRLESPTSLELTLRKQLAQRDPREGVKLPAHQKLL